MQSPRWPAFFACALLIISARAQSNGEVALTFDDLPVHGPLPQGITRTQVLGQIANVLRNADAPPAYGFINAQGLDSADHRDALDVWRAAGLPLANHTYSHMDLHANSVEAFSADIIANEPILERLMGEGNLHWFRYPYLREGESPIKREQIRGLLDERDYRIAQVTIDFQDYAYNEPYVRCFSRGDFQAITRLKQSYLHRAAESIDESEQAAKRIYGRSIKHVMLLHVGAFQPLVLPQLLELLRERRYALITLEAAQNDAAYAIDPDVTLPYGTTLLQQMSIAKGIPGIPYSEEELKAIDQTCQ